MDGCYGACRGYRAVGVCSSDKTQGHIRNKVEELKHASVIDTEDAYGHHRFGKAVLCYDAARTNTLIPAYGGSHGSNAHCDTRPGP